MQLVHLCLQLSSKFCRGLYVNRSMTTDVINHAAFAVCICYYFPGRNRSTGWLANNRAMVCMSVLANGELSTAQDWCPCCCACRHVQRRTDLQLPSCASLLLLLQTLFCSTMILLEVAPFVANVSTKGNDVQHALLEVNLFAHLCVCCATADAPPVCLQISAAFSGGSAIAVLVGGMLFCRYTGAGRRNFITALAALAASCFFILTK